MTNILLFVSTTLIWGSTWFAIKLQLGVVPPEVSLVYRFGLAAAIAAAYCVIRGISLKLGVRGNLLVAIQGILLFSANYYFVYLASFEMSSGVLAVVFSSIILFNILLKKMVFGGTVERRVLAGAILGLMGIGLVFFQELRQATSLAGFGYALLGTAISSGGNIMSAWNQKQGLPVASSNALGMAYGTIVLVLIVSLAGIPYAFDPSPEYVGSLLFLAIFGSFVGFWTYLTLLGKIGPDRAAYIMVVFPLIALAISTVAEGYVWSPAAVLGILFILGGNIFILTRRTPS